MLENDRRFGTIELPTQCTAEGIGGDNRRHCRVAGTIAWALRVGGQGLGCTLPI
jgi:hypothetical protein